jgi:CRP/FNR family transcriptional regulator
MSDLIGTIKKQLSTHFPIFSQYDLIDSLSQKGVLKTIPKGTAILEVGSFIRIIPLVIEGTVKVIREDESGAEMLLYYINAGESCAMTLSSCFKREKSRVKAITQTDVNVLAVPVEEVYDLLRRYHSWQDFVLHTYQIRFEEMMEVLDNVVFHKLDERLLKYLHDRSNALRKTELHISHQEIADDLASSREVISRLLKQMERKGYVQLSRGKIILKVDR